MDIKEVSGEIADKKNHIKTDIYDLWLKNGIIYGSYSKGTVVDLQISKQVLRDRNVLSKGKAYPILGYASNVKYWTKEAKEFHSSEEYARLVKAVALIFPSGIVSVLYNFYVRFYKSKFPIRSFSNEQEALKWLEKYK